MITDFSTKHQRNVLVNLQGFFIKKAGQLKRDSWQWIWHLTDLIKENNQTCSTSNSTSSSHTLFCSLMIPPHQLTLQVCRKILSLLFGLFCSSSALPSTDSFSLLHLNAAAGNSRPLSTLSVLLRHDRPAKTLRLRGCQNRSMPCEHWKENVNITQPDDLLVSQFSHLSLLPKALCTVTTWLVSCDKCGKDTAVDVRTILFAFHNK